MPSLMPHMQLVHVFIKKKKTEKNTRQKITHSDLTDKTTKPSSVPLVLLLLGNRENSRKAERRKSFSLCSCFYAVRFLTLIKLFPIARYVYYKWYNVKYIYLSADIFLVGLHCRNIKF